MSRPARLPLGALVLVGSGALLAHVAIRHRDGTATVSYYSDACQPTLARGRYPDAELKPVAIRWANAAEDLPPGTSYVSDIYGSVEAAREAALPFHRFVLPCYRPPGRSPVILPDPDAWAAAKAAGYSVRKGNAPGDSAYYVYDPEGFEVGPNAGYFTTLAAWRAAGRLARKG